MSQDYEEVARALTEYWPPMPLDIATHVGRLLTGLVDHDTQQ